jgi:hypothetical protein
MKAREDKCGCRYTEYHYVAMCPTHAAEFKARHEQANRDHFTALDVMAAIVTATTKQVTP